MAKKPTFYRDGDKYIVLTGESPKGFTGYLFAAFAGPDARSVEEGVISLDDLNKMESIEGDDIPDDWADMFRHKGIAIDERKPEPTPEPQQPCKSRKPSKPPPRQATELTFNLKPGRSFQNLFMVWMVLTGFIFMLIIGCEFAGRLSQ